MVKITTVKSWSENLELTRPYSIAYNTFDSVENVFVYLQLADGKYGLGAGSPADLVTGESLDDSKSILADKLPELLVGKDVRLIQEHCRNMEKQMSKTPAARAAVDIALHDALSKFLNIPLVDMLGRVHQALPTSITIGIKSLEESLAEAEEYIGRGFRILKVKTGKSVEEDVELVNKMREEIGSQIRIRVDANQGYSASELQAFIQRTSELDIELVEQPLKDNDNQGMFDVTEEIRKQCAADESLHNPADALKLAANPQAFGIYNIKLMKCGGVNAGMQIAEIANLAGIDLMWGCMDESIVSITAALHAALASPATRYLDLDGSLDLARDLVTGGFVLEDGYLGITDQAGLGINMTEGNIHHEG